jgi:hypothetical protein
MADPILHSGGDGGDSGGAPRRVERRAVESGAEAKAGGLVEETMCERTPLWHPRAAIRSPTHVGRQ